MAKRRGFLWRATTLQALAESWLLGGVALIGLTFSHDRIGSDILANAIFFTVPLVALWDALRLRVPDGKGLVRHLRHELRAALAAHYDVGRELEATVFAKDLSNKLADMVSRLKNIQALF